MQHTSSFHLRQQTMFIQPQVLTSSWSRVHTFHRLALRSEKSICNRFNSLSIKRSSRSSTYATLGKDTQDNGKHNQDQRFSLNGKVTVVTGGHRGIGAAISIAVARAGSDVVVIDKGGPKDSEVPSVIKQLGRRHWSVKADVSDTKGIERAVKETISVVGRGVDVLVNNAGITGLAPLEELSVETWDLVMNINLRAPFLLSQGFVKGEDGMLVRGNGVIINITSVAGIDAIDLHGSYCASKAGLNMLTKVMTVEWAGRGIRANAIAPTVVLTEMGKEVWGKAEVGDPMKAKIPQGRFAQPFEVADGVVYLASEASSMINGIVLSVDGGYTCM